MTKGEKVNAAVTCPLCKKSDTRLITGKVRFGRKADVYKCRSCTLTFIDQDSFVFPKDFYEKNYHQTYLTHIEPDAVNPRAYYEKMKKINEVWADKFAGMLTGKEVVLDLGCSTGHFMDLVKNKVKKIYGHELSKKEVEFCRDTLKLDVSDQPLEKRFKEGVFDYIIMIYVLEHIARPKDFLRSMKKFLKTDGKFVILIPNARDALVDFYDIPSFKNFYYCIEHFYYYTPATIKRLFDEVGLEGEIEVVQEYPVTNHLNWGYTRSPRDAAASRKGEPDIPLAEGAPTGNWTKLWERFDRMYKAFLKENGYGDRIWCTVGRKR